MSDKKKCPFCEAIALQRFIEEHHSKPAGFGMALSAALVSYAVVNGRKCGRTTDYMKDGKGYVVEFLNSKGFKIDAETLDKLIEAAVFNLPDYFTISGIPADTDSNKE